jgi:hypothetical protein
VHQVGWIDGHGGDVLLIDASGMPHVRALQRIDLIAAGQRQQADCGGGP